MLNVNKLKQLFTILLAFGIPVLMQAQITVDFNASTACESAPVNFTDFSTDASADSIILRVWDLNNDGSFTNDTGTVANWLFTGNGSFTVGLKVYSSSGDSAQQYSAVTVSPIPIADFTTLNTCTGDSLTATNASTLNGTTINVYEWFFDGTSTLANVSSENYMFSTSGLHKVRLKITTLDGCEANAEKDIQINPSPNANFTFSKPCLGDSLELEATSTISFGTIVNHEWDVNNDDDFSDDSGNEIKLLPKAAGDWTVNLRATSQLGCTNVSSQVITVNPKPYVNFLVNNACAGTDIGLSNLSFSAVGNMTFLWNFDDGDTSTSKEPIKSFSNSGNALIELVGSNIFGCKDSLQRTIQISAVPVASISAKDVCQGEAIDFAFTGSGNTKNTIWDFGNGAGAVGSNVKYTFPDSGQYTVQVVAVNLENCYDTATQVVNIWETPENEIEYSASLSFCPGGNVVLNAKNINHNLLWNTGSTLSFIAANEGKDYSLVTYTNKGCQHFTSVTTVALQAPTLTLVDKHTISLGENVTVETEGNYSTIEWKDLNGNTLGTLPTFTASPQQTVQYQVTAKSEEGCEVVDTVLVVAIKDFKFLANTVVTPNQDGKNDFWEVKNLSTYPACVLTIYNRWGKEVYTTANYQNDWDGRDNNGTQLPTGTYYYTITCDEINRTWEGPISLLRAE